PTGHRQKKRPKRPPGEAPRGIRRKLAPGCRRCWCRLGLGERCGASALPAGCALAPGTVGKAAPAAAPRPAAFHNSGCIPWPGRKACSVPAGAARRPGAGAPRSIPCASVSAGSGTQERDKGAKAASAPRSAPFAPRVTCEYAFVKRSYLTATLATCSLSAAAPSSSFRRPQSGSIPTKSASCSYHALSRKARASAAQYGFPDVRSNWACRRTASARSFHGFLTGSSRSGRRFLPLANRARFIVITCRVIGSSHLPLSNPSTRKPLGLVHLAQLVGRRREKQGHFGLGVRHESSRRRLRGLLVPGQDDRFA